MSALPVSIAKFLVRWRIESAARSLYKTGEHFTANDGFFSPGRCATGGRLKPALVYIYTVFVIVSSDVSDAYLNTPLGVRSRLPSGVNVNRRKNDVNVSL
jgi:hypothetical protein